MERTIAKWNFHMDVVVVKLRNGFIGIHVHMRHPCEPTQRPFFGGARKSAHYEVGTAVFFVYLVTN